MKLFKLLFISFSIVILLLFAGEIGLRQAGYKPSSPISASASPPEFIETDSLLGYKLKEGHFFMASRAEATHMQGQRLCQPTDDNPYSIDLPEIWVLGDEYTYGWQLKDSDTYLWRLQQELSKYKIVNLSVPGYSTVQSLLQLKRMLTEQVPPQTVILAYGSHQNVRNTNNPSKRKRIISGDFLIPTARLGDNKELSFERTKAEYSALPLSSSLALMNWLEHQRNEQEYGTLKTNELTQRLVQDIFEMCRSRYIDFYLMTLTQDEKTNELLSFCDGRGIAFFDISINLSEPHLLLPDGSYPNAAANELYAAKLAQFMHDHLGKR